MANILGTDVGGTGIKAALVDTATGKLISDRHRIGTPAVSTPENVATTVRQLVAEFVYSGAVGCCFRQSSLAAALVKRSQTTGTRSKF